jgi:hypothetical protein
MWALALPIIAQRIFLSTIARPINFAESRLGRSPTAWAYQPKKYYIRVTSPIGQRFYHLMGYAFNPFT